MTKPNNKQSNNQDKTEKEIWGPGALLSPVPAAMISCYHPDFGQNIITMSWIATICTKPAMLSISIRPERHSYPIIKESGEFVVNLTNKNLAWLADWCGVVSGKNVDKFKEKNIKTSKAKFVSAPLINDSPLNIECQVKEIIPLGSHHLFIANVLAVHVDKKLISETGELQLYKANPLVYSHGHYFETGKHIGRFGHSVQKNKQKNQQKNKKTNNKPKRFIIPNH
jgi:flavin reductase (DIM6/NTAB) family NADH-FMN oxidoreductase RutF